MTRVMLETLEVAVHLGLWIMLVAFGLWVYRRARLRSMLWFEAYLLVYLPLSEAVDRVFSQIDVIRRFAEQGGPFGWTSGQFIVSWTAWRSLLDGLVLIVVATLVMADIIFLLRKVGTPVAPPPMRFSLWIRDRSVYLGAALLILIALLPLTTGAVLMYLY